jgi:Spy/CpxP family protein refolding chaperone
MNVEEPHMKTVFRLLSLVLCLMAPDLSSAQVEQQEDPFGAFLFTPEEIMQHRRAIQLNDEQRDGITRLIEELQGRLVGLQWRLLDETEAVKEAMEGPRVDMDRIMDRFGKALNTEMEIKRVHLELLIRIKNILSPEQQRELTRLRSTDGSEETKSSESHRSPV